MYHRVIDVPYDPWQLAVSPVNFEQHLQVLKKNYNIHSVKSLVKQLRRKSVSSNRIYITFDDGYNDNFYAAKPLLEKYYCPATFFVATHFIDQQQPFWSDELLTILFKVEKLPEILSLLIGNEAFEYKLENEGILTEEEKNKQNAWIWSDEPPNRRCGLYLALWERLRPLPYDEISALLTRIKYWAGFTEFVNKDNFPMTREQLKGMSNNPLFEIGIHTVTHPALSFHNKEVQQQEIRACRQYLQNNCKDSLAVVAYPYGNYNEITLSAVKEEKIVIAFTTEEQPVTGNSDLFRLGRFQVKNWTGEEFEKQLHKWTKDY